MVRVAVFCGPSLKRNLKGSRGLSLEFFPPSSEVPGELHALEGILVEAPSRFSGPLLKALRKALPQRSVGAVCLRPSAEDLSKVHELGFDFHVTSWGPGTPP